VKLLFPKPISGSRQMVLDKNSYPLSLRILEVATLAEKNLPAGRHTVEWNAEGMADGVYFCRLKTGEFVQTKKLTLIR
jgi:hypothetical protein